MSTSAEPSILTLSTPINANYKVQTLTVFNPTCYYGDQEVDIAMSELFAPLPKDCYSTYDAHHPLSQNYENRKLI